MRHKNNWSAIKMSKQQQKLAKAAENQKKLTFEELVAEGDKAYEEMQKAKVRKTLN